MQSDLAPKRLTAMLGVIEPAATASFGSELVAGVSICGATSGAVAGGARAAAKGVPALTAVVDGTCGLLKKLSSDALPVLTTLLRRGAALLLNAPDADISAFFSAAAEKVPFGRRRGASVR